MHAIIRNYGYFIYFLFVGGSSYRGLSMRGRKHVQGRSDCLNYFTKFYKNGRLPLVYTHAKLVHQPISSYYTQDKLV